MALNCAGGGFGRGTSGFRGKGCLTGAPLLSILTRVCIDLPNSEEDNARGFLKIRNAEGTSEWCRREGRGWRGGEG